jgi:hypothetical protein
MIIRNYNHTNEYPSGSVWNIIKTICEDVEQSENLPSQREFVKFLRESGWDEKVRIGEFSNHSIDGILERVGVCVYFGHSKAAFQKLMALQSLYLDRQIKECYYITQSEEVAQFRHRSANPKAREGTDGNRITFEKLTSGMDYYSRFIEVPMTIIGIEMNV